MVHVVPSNADCLILFINESDSGDGVSISRVKYGQLHRISLVSTTIPETTVSNKGFSSDASRIPLFLTIAHWPVPGNDRHLLHRLCSWSRVRRDDGRIYNIVYGPCNDYTVQIVKTIPDNLCLHTASHACVPEYGLDIIWRRHPSGNNKLVFAAMLHSAV